MSKAVQLRCRCGHVRGQVTAAAPESVTRVICYCDDCQAFAHHLGRPELLDPHAGSDIIQIAPSALSFDAGFDRVTAVRLSGKGLYRFFSSCCRTPLGNCLSPAIPFIGVIASSFEVAEQKPDEIFGAPIGKILGKFAVGGAPAGSEGLNLSVVWRAGTMMLGWKLRGKTWPHPFFEQGAKVPRLPVAVLSAEEREALRPLCGPNPTTPRERSA